MNELAPPPPNHLLGCECCGLVSWTPALAGAHEAALRCPRCHHPLHLRHPASIERTWAWIVTAALLYVPANVLPIMTTSDLFGQSSYTIASGIAELWTSGSYTLAAIVFIASIAVPLLKIGALALLAWSVSRLPDWRRPERARLFRIVETVGHWSMLDVYVVVVLAGLVRFGHVAGVQPEPGLLAFATVVVVTMLAARSFDPRLIWPEEGTHG
jgi:paraquat-inducible protein A